MAILRGTSVSNVLGISLLCPDLIVPKQHIDENALNGVIHTHLDSISVGKFDLSLTLM